jgi:hypothetical protein
MFRAMAFKELREIRGLALLAFLAYGLLVVGTTDPRSSANVFTILQSYRLREGGIPFVSDGFHGFFLQISVIFAIGLGLRQSLGESVRGTYLFLLHRPASRSWLMEVKLLTGLAVYLICSAIPIVIYGAWAATPGNHASPFCWAMTLPTWGAWATMTVLYLGAFLSAIRPGRWYRSRLLPLAAAAIAAIFVSERESLLWVCVIVVVADVWLIAMILFVARARDYT